MIEVRNIQKVSGKPEVGPKNQWHQWLIHIQDQLIRMICQSSRYQKPEIIKEYKNDIQQIIKCFLSFVDTDLKCYHQYLKDEHTQQGQTQYPFKIEHQLIYNLFVQLSFHSQSEFELKDDAAEHAFCSPKRGIET
jgi:hypothetical protein